ncbi:hypothetical protein RHMOL_Rhmol07G0292400 [Rhododendron molle]|uniref:Uncharacterized protein n=1 Tax=Rhododendron molle TaxID=49168 RepID=A0ACC0N6F8_RHOML|nr:hypothetical protein RHMOL_Rhmol07G0292400 [Rhododendron molle]
MVVDGTSYWHFFKMLSHAFRAQEENPEIPRPPVLTRWFPEGYGPVLNLPFSHHDQFISRLEPPRLRERIFHLSSESIAKLKSKANSESKTNKISSFQAVSALVWRCVTRARRLPHDQETSCTLAANNRARMDPPLPTEYFGNLAQTVRGNASAGELLRHRFGWAAWQFHEAVAGHCDAAVREWVGNWVKDPFIYQIEQFFGTFSLWMGSSPRFEMYENEFGMGRAVAVRSGNANKFDGKVTSYPGHEGGGSMDLEVCLPPETMAVLESDGEFMGAVCSY